MRGARAKQIRRTVYGDMSLRDKAIRSQESILMRVVRFFTKDEKTGMKTREVEQERRTIKNTGLRRMYQGVKRNWKRRKMSWFKKNSVNAADSR